MAYAGIPSELTKQPAPSTSSGRVGSSKSLLSLIVILAIIVVVAMATAFLAGSNRGVGLPTADRSYDQIEAQRGATTLAATAADRSYDQIEAQRGAPLSVGPAGLSRAQIASLQASGGSAGLSRAQIASLQASIAAAGQSLQGSVSRMVYQTAPHVTLRRTAHKAVATEDHSYDSIENFRLNMR
jgi:hypothetical protein